MNRFLASVLAFGFAASLGLAQPGDAPVRLKPGMIIVCAQDKVKAGSGRAIAYVWDGKADSKPVILRKQSKLQDITAFVVARNGQQYYLDGMHGTPVIMQADKTGKNEREFFRDKDVGLLRDLALDDDDNVYLSVAGENKVFPAHHKIYKVRPGNKDKAASAELFCEVPVKDLVEKQWVGGFAFGMNDEGGFDTNTLYLCVWGNAPATKKGPKGDFIATGEFGSIYRMTRKDGEWSKPERVLASKEPIYGLWFTGPREAYYAAEKNRSTDPAKITFHLYRFTDLKKSVPVLTLDNAGKIWSVSVVRGETIVFHDPIVIPRDK
jgi:hypothetical protein